MCSGDLVRGSSYIISRFNFPYFLFCYRLMCKSDNIDLMIVVNRPAVDGVGAVH